MTKSNDALFPRINGTLDPRGLGDNLYAAAHTIEQLLLDSGATPGVDYTRMDLLKLAQPFVLESTRNSGDNLLWYFPENPDD